MCIADVNVVKQVLFDRNGLYPKNIDNPHIARLLGKGELKAKLNLKVAGASKGAREAVEKAGGSVEIIEARDPAARRPATVLTSIVAIVP